MAAAVRQESTRTGLALALLGFSIMACGDAVVKSMAGAWPGSAVSALRFVIGAAALTALVAAVHGRDGFALPRPWLQAGRGAAIAFASLCFFMGVMAMPLADATSIQFTSPILTVFLAAAFLGERTPRAAIGAIALAFAGVLVVLRPNLLEIGLPAFYPLGAALGMASLMVLNRKAAGTAPILVMQWTMAVAAAPVLVVAAALLHLTGKPEFQIPAPGLAIVLKCMAVAACATMGHLLLYAATSRARAASVSPMTYVQLLIAAGLGWLWFGDRPDAATFAGAGLIIAGGLLLWRMQGQGEKT